MSSYSSSPVTERYYDNKYAPIINSQQEYYKESYYKLQVNTLNEKIRMLQQDIHYSYSEQPNLETRNTLAFLKEKRAYIINQNPEVFI